jgi:drug/metabolite transporter (DMT)-like permease
MVGYNSFWSVAVLADELRWEYVLAIVVVVVAGVCLALGRMDAKDFISVVGIVIGFLGGAVYGMYRARWLRRG